MQNIPHRPHIPPGLIAGLVVLALVPIIGAGAWLWLQWAALASSYPLVADTIRIALPLGITALALYYGWLGALGLYNRWASKVAAYADKEIAHTRARVQVAPLAQHLHYEVTSSSTQAEPLALPAPIEVVKPMAEWMAWVDDQPHTLLGGKTRAGKTWLATALLERRIESGCDLFHLDPHSSDWLGLPTAGGSGIPERREALKAILNEYLRRMAIREEHKRKTGHELPHDYFDPLICLIDEANALYEELAAEWKTVLKQVASGSRKVGISLLMLAQSPLVEDLGISGAMRENFSRIALDERSCQAMIDSERNRERKAALQEALKTMDRPAAAQIGPQAWRLDRRGLQPGHASADVQMWGGWDSDRGCRVSSVSEAADGNEP